MPGDPHIVLIGLRGCGKSTLGKWLADAVDLPFTDLDALVAQRMGLAGPGEVIDQHGIDRFREEETKALAHAIDQPTGIIALGGGTPTAPGAADVLGDERTRIFYLRAQPETLADRLKNADNTDRPALIGDNPISEIQTLFDQRDGLYQSLAESIVHVDGVSEDAALAAIVALTRAGV